MPPLDEQLAVPGSLPAPFSAVRALLKPGRTYQDAVDTFQPYDRIQEPIPAIRQALADTVVRCMKEDKN